MKFVRDVPCSSAINIVVSQLHAADDAIEPFAAADGADERTEFASA